MVFIVLITIEQEYAQRIAQIAHGTVGESKHVRIQKLCDLSREASFMMYWIHVTLYDRIAVCVLDCDRVYANVSPQLSSSATGLSSSETLSYRQYNTTLLRVWRSRCGKTSTSSTDRE